MEEIRIINTGGLYIFQNIKMPSSTYTINFIFTISIVIKQTENNTRTCIFHMTNCKRKLWGFHSPSLRGAEKHMPSSLRGLKTLVA